MKTQFGSKSKGASSRWGLLSAIIIASSTSTNLQAHSSETAPQPNDSLEEVVVTGSRIKRRDFTSPSPIASIDASFLEFTPQPTLEEVLNQMPQVQPDFGRSSNNPGDGTSRLNLRGLGSQRTLVMLNGRRLAPSGPGSAVDVNNLPKALIERVEVITGGASTVYGSDAVAGVVNFITRKNVDGLSVNATTYVTEQGDSEVHDFNALYGSDFSDGRGSLKIFAGALERKASFGADREISQVPFFDDLQGNILPSGSSAIPEGRVGFPRVDLGNGLTQARFDADGNLVPFVRPDDLYNFAPINFLQTPLTRYTGGIFVDYDVSDRMETYLELTFTRNEASRSLAPVPLGTFLAINLDNPILTPQFRQIATDQFLPAGPNTVLFGLLRRLEEVGLREIDRNQDYQRLVAGVRGAITDNWDYDAWITYTDSKEELRQANGVSASRIQQGLLVDPLTGQCFDPTDGCVPINLFGLGNLSPEAAEFLRLAPLVSASKRTQKVASAFITGTPVDTWAGPVDTAFGLEWRDDRGRFIADDALFTGDALGYGGSAPIIGSEEVFELYAEAIVPLARDMRFARSISLELGARFSDYDNAGSVESYKFGGEWQVVDNLRFRAMAQRSVRAPNLQEAFLDTVTGVSTFTQNGSTDDPCSASADPVGRGNAERCALQGIPSDQIGVFEAEAGFPTTFFSGGNTELTPETADTLTAGLVFSFDAAPNWQFAMDYFDLEVEDTIGDIDASAICFDAGNTNNIFCDNIVRDPITLNVVEVVERTSNRGRSDVSGVDTQINYQRELPDWLALNGAAADLDVNVYWTHLLSKTEQLNPVTTRFNCRGQFGSPCDSEPGTQTFPENRVTTNANYRSGNLNMQLTWRWIDGSDNALPQALAAEGFVDPLLSIPSIGSKNYFDLGLGYDFTESIRGTLNIANLFDTDPPFVADQSRANNTDSALYDIFGRAFQVGVSLNFR